MSSSTDHQRATAPGTADARTGAEATVEALVHARIEHVIGLPGTTIMDVIDVLAGREDIRYLSVRHEQAAAHMADGYWRAREQLAACLVSRGPGAANLAIGMHNAYAESIPVLALVGQVPDALAHREAFEELDLVAFFKPLTKWAIDVHDSRRLTELVTRAARTAAAGRPRPVMVSLPLDVLQARDHQSQLTTSSTPARHPRPDPDDLADVVDILRGAQRPTLVLGGGMLRPRWSDDAMALARTLAAPVVTTWMRQNAYPNHDPQFVGTLGYGAHAAAEQAVVESDVILALGCRFSEFSTRRYTLVPDEATIVQVDLDAQEIGAIYPGAVGLVGDAWQVVGSLCAGLTGETPSRVASHRATILRRQYETQCVVPDDRGGQARGVGSGALAAALQRTVRVHDVIVVQDTHSFGPWLSRYVAFDRPGTHYGAAGGSMGWGVPAALGVQLARPDERVLAVCGDGSFWMVAQELETAVREDLPVVFVITNNFSYGNTRDRQKMSHGGRYAGVFHSNPDFAAFARLLGAHGERIERGDDLDAAIERALAAGSPAVLDVIQDPMEGLPPDLVPLAAE